VAVTFTGATHRGIVTALWPVTSQTYDGSSDNVSVGHDPLGGKATSATTSWAALAAKNRPGGRRHHHLPVDTLGEVGWLLVHKGPARFDVRR